MTKCSFISVFSIQHQWNCPYEMCVFNPDLPLEPVCMQSTPSLELFSLTCLDLIEARVSIGLRPEFSAKDMGTESRASANALMAYCSRPALYMQDNY